MQGIIKSFRREIDIMKDEMPLIFWEHSPTL